MLWLDVWPATLRQRCHGLFNERLVECKRHDVMHFQLVRNMFVAGFIGSPKMNLITGGEAGKYDAHTIGVRPEHIDVVESGGQWQGTVGVAEHLGSDTFFHIHNTGLAEMVTVRAIGDVSLTHGDTIHLTPRTGEIHRFDVGGLRIA